MKCNTCNYKIGKLKTMKTKQLAASALATALGIGGAVGSQEIRKMIPAETLDPMYTNIGLVVLGGLALPMLGKGKSSAYISSLGNGMAVEAGLQLVNQYLMPATAVSGYNNEGPGLYGVNNAGPGLYGSMPSYPGTNGATTSL
jgi:hypothetical protein